MSDITVSVVIPVAPYHENVLSRALQSLALQSVPCQVYYGIDNEKKGAGFVRNRLLERVETPYVVFLDADDWLETTFLEEALKVIQPNHYVYTDWLEGSIEIVAPDNPWCAEQWHLITTLCNTAEVKSVGMFDEWLGSLEDTDFWLRMTTSQICGIHVKKPLVHYGREGKRGKTAQEDGSANALRQLILERYKNKVGCCGKPNPVKELYPVGAKQPGDIMAQALWGGNRTEHGRATGRMYPRMSYPKLTWLDPRDAQLSPNLWRVITPTETAPAPQELSISDNTVEEAPPKSVTITGDLLAKRGTFGQPMPEKQPVTPLFLLGDASDAYKPDVANVVRKAKKALGAKA